MSRIDRLTQAFTRFPGIGPRQAKRFVYFLLNQPKSYHRELADLLSNLDQNINQCSLCFQYFTPTGSESLCNICSDQNREKTLMVVEKDVDLENIERAGVYKGRYFVLGGTVPILEKEPENKIRIKELIGYLSRDAFDEIILAMSANPEGDNTGDYVKKELESENSSLKITLLGRGLSTGSELEYSDTETIRNAFNNRN